MGYEFQFIVDGRFPKDYGKTHETLTEEDLKNHLIKLDNQIKERIISLDGVTLKSGYMRRLKFPREKIFDDITDSELVTIQYRIHYCIYKDTRQYSWNTLFGIINSVQVCGYDKI
jgi:hypothetical protein